MWTTDDTASDVEGILLLFAAAVLGAGMMVEVLKHTDTTAWEREMLKMSVRTSVSSVLQHPTREVIWACCIPGTDCSVLLTSSTDTLRGSSPGRTVNLELGEELEASKAGIKCVKGIWEMHLSCCSQ